MVKIACLFWWIHYLDHFKALLCHFLYISRLCLFKHLWSKAYFWHKQQIPTPRPRSGGCPGAGGPTGAIPCWRSGRVVGGDTLIQGKEQWLCFAGAAVKRYPTPKVRETQVTWYVLQEGIRGQTHWNHTHRNLVSLITLGPQPCLTQWN